MLTGRSRTTRCTSPIDTSFQWSLPPLTEKILKPRCLRSSLLRTVSVMYENRHHTGLRPRGTLYFGPRSPSRLCVSKGTLVLKVETTVAFSANQIFIADTVVVFFVMNVPWCTPRRENICQDICQLPFLLILTFSIRKVSLCL